MQLFRLSDVQQYENTGCYQIAQRKRVQPEIQIQKEAAKDSLPNNASNYEQGINVRLA